jgi:hypothetical protein
MNLAELVDFCIEHDIDQTKVTFWYGHKEVIACLEEGAIEQLRWPNDFKYATMMENTFDDWLLINEELISGCDLYWSSEYDAYVKRID